LAAKCLSAAAVTERTHVAIWKWVQKYSAIAADGFRTDRRGLVREILFVDETLFSR
jgi:hypothetical protein